MSGPGNTGRDIRLEHVFAAAREKWFAQLHTSIPGKVVKVDASKQRADVQPLVKVRYLDETGNYQIEALPVVTNCPVAMLAGGGFGFTVPVAEGDTGWLVFAETSIGKWVTQGGGPVDPFDYHRHDLSDAAFFPGVVPFPSARSSAPSDRARMGKDGGLALEVTASQILLGGDAATQAIPNGDLLHTAMSTLTTALSTMMTALAAALTATAASETVLSVAFPPDAGPASAAATALVAAATAVTAVITQLGTFDAGWSTYLSTVGKVKP